MNTKQAQPGQGSSDAPPPIDSGPSGIPMRPGDEAPEAAPGTGENVCPRCGGSGNVDGKACPSCDGTGEVTTAIGGG